MEWVPCAQLRERARRLRSNNKNRYNCMHWCVWGRVCVCKRVWVWVETFKSWEPTNQPASNIFNETAEQNVRCDNRTKCTKVKQQKSKAAKHSKEGETTTLNVDAPFSYCFVVVASVDFEAQNHIRINVVSYTYADGSSNNNNECKYVSKWALKKKECRV